MSDIIFQNIIDKIYSASENINSYFSNFDIYNNNLYDILYKLPKYNLVIYLFIILLINSFIGGLNIRLNEIMTFLVCVLVVFYLTNKDYKEFINFTKQKRKQLDFLHKLMFNDHNWVMEKKDELILKPVASTQKSYLYLNPLIIELFYNCREYSQYNISSYVNSLIHANNVIGMEFEIKLGLDHQFYTYDMAIDETNKSLNEFNSIIYNLPSALLAYTKFKETKHKLHQLLNQHLLDMSILCKNRNKIKEVNIYSMPDNFYDREAYIAPNDMDTSDYKSPYNSY
jgi:hypothetical protein